MGTPPEVLAKHRRDVREKKIRRAFALLDQMHFDDIAVVRRWVKQGDINEKELKRRMDEYEQWNLGVFRRYAEAQKAAQVAQEKP